MDQVQTQIHIPLSSLFKVEIVPLVQERLQEVLASEGSLESVLNYVLASNGKMIRPVLVATVYELCERRSDFSRSIVDIASGVELIHLASLIHDDIIDSSETRRGAPTVQSRFGAPAAVLSGDYLFAKAFSLFTIHDQNDVLNLMTNVICKMCEGEIQQLLDPGVDEQYYWEYIYRKTGCLIESACCAGAMISKNRSVENIELIGEYGRNLGYAFQLIDDLLDYSETGFSMGKSPGDDFLQGIWTLPVIRGVERGILDHNWMNTATYEETRVKLVTHGILAEIEQEAFNHIERAQDVLLQFPDSSSRNQLFKLAEFVGNRKH